MEMLLGNVRNSNLNVNKGSIFTVLKSINFITIHFFQIIYKAMSVYQAVK